MCGIVEIFCFKVGLVVDEWRGLMFEGGEIEVIVKKRLDDGIGFLGGGDGVGVQVVFFIEVIENELIVIVGSELQVVPGGAFDGDGWVGEADGDVVPLRGPGEMFDESLGFGPGAWFEVREFTGFVVV